MGHRSSDDSVRLGRYKIGPYANQPALDPSVRGVALAVSMIDERKAEQAKDGDRRGLKRTRVSRNAKIIVPRRSSVIFCTVENITGGGACLKLASTFGVPDTFDLTFEHGRTRRLCRVVWRSSDKLGVTFETAEERSPLELRHGSDHPFDVFRP